jgi:hypothetical protein
VQDDSRSLRMLDASRPIALGCGFHVETRW